MRYFPGYGKKSTLWALLVCATLPLRLGGQTYMDQIPLSFEPNRGQADKSVQFIARGRGYTMFLAGRETWLYRASPAITGRDGVSRTAHSRKASPLEMGATDTLVRVSITGGNPSAAAAGEGELPGHSSYFIGNDPAQWRTGIPNYSRVRVPGVYAGVDLVYYGNQREIEYDFLVHPGADPSMIQLDYDGVREIVADGSGGLTLRTEAGAFYQRRPVMYQETAGVRSTVEGGYTVTGSRVGFRLGSYDRSRPLVIDPILSYATFLGGSSGEVATDIAADRDGNVYVFGTTASANFPVRSGSYQGSIRGDFDLFVTKIDSTGKNILYSTYIGGNSDEFSSAIAVDRDGNSYLAAGTISTSYPTTQGAYMTSTTDGCCEDIVISRLSADGSRLLNSTYLTGSNNHDIPYDIALDSAGNVYVAGATGSSFPRATERLTGTRGDLDAFVAKFPQTLISLDGYAILAGRQVDEALAVSIDGAGNIYVGGDTKSTDFPSTQGSLQPATGGRQDGWVAEFSPAFGLLYSTLLGGTSDDSIWNVAATTGGAVYVTGRTSSTDFRTTTGAIQTAYKGGANDAFVAKLNPNGSSFGFSTLLGGRGDDRAYALVLDSSENVYVVGRTDSTDFPLQGDALQRNVAGGYDMFAAKMNSTASQLSYATLFGGSGDDDAFAAAMDGAGRLYVAGQTTSGNFGATSGSPQQALTGTLDAVVVRFEIPGSSASPSGPAAIVMISGNSQTGPAGSTLAAPLVVEVRDASGAPVPDSAVTFSASNATVNPTSARTNSSGRASATVTLGSTAGTATITASVAGLPSITFSATVTAVSSQAPAISEIVDGAAFLPAIAELGWVTIKGTRLSTSTRSWASGDFVGDRLPTTIDGVSVTMNGRPAAVAYVSPTQLNVLAPRFNATGSVTVVVTNSSGTASRTATVQATAPMFFMLDPENRRYVAAVNLDGSLVGRAGLFPANPNLTKPLVARGRASIYGAGWGTTNPAQPDDVTFNGARPLTSSASVRITIGGQPATVEFAGAVSPGLYQFNIIAPDLPAGDYPLVGEIAGIRTQPGTFITLSAAPAPSITSVDPASGQAGQVIETLTIVGQTLANVTSLEFSPATGISSSILSASANRITARVVIAAAAAVGQRTILVRDGSRLSNALSFAVTPAPQLRITSLNPANSPPGRIIETFTIRGENLTGVTGVGISPAAETSISLVSATDTEVVARLEIGSNASPGSKSITVRDATRTSNALTFTVTPPPPTLTAISPSSVEVSQILTDFRISGQNLGTSPQVTFTPNQGISVLARGASGSLFLYIGNDASPGDRMVTVTTSAGQSNAIPLTIRPRSGNFTISNLRATSPAGANGTFSLTVDFNDPSGSAANGVNYTIAFNDLGFISTSALPQGVVTGRTSGTIRIDMSAGRNVSRIGSVRFNLINPAGQRSNTLEGVF